MQFALTIDPSPFDLAKTFDDLADQLTDFRPVWPRIAPHLSAGFRRNLISQGTAAGEHWEPLSPGYARRKARRYGSVPILYRSGALLREMGNARPLAISRTFFDHGIPIGGDSYAHDMHFGFRNADTRIPARPFVLLNREMRSVAVRLIEDHVGEILAKAGRSLRRGAAS